jgi:serine/threonine-protein kinase
VVAVYDYGEQDGLAYLVMEHVEGGSLKGLLDKGERLPLKEVARVMDELLAALAHAHEKGVVHRDIKPANVMLTRSGQVKVTDFGIARIESSTMTQAGTVLGTPAYMSPEQFRGEPVDPRTDVYSAGVVLYQLLTGDKPFEGSFTAIMHKVLNVEPPRPSEISGAVPPPLDAVVAKAMAKRPQARFESAAAFRTALAEAIRTAEAAPAATIAGVDLDATVIERRPASPAPERAPAKTGPAGGGAEPRRRVPVALLAALPLALAAAAGAAWYVLLREPEPAVIATAESPAPPPMVLQPQPLPDPPRPPPASTPSPPAAPRPTEPSPPAPPQRVETAPQPAPQRAEPPPAPPQRAETASQPAPQRAEPTPAPPQRVETASQPAPQRAEPAPTSDPRPASPAPVVAPPPIVQAPPAQQLALAPTGGALASAVAAALAESRCSLVSGGIEAGSRVRLTGYAQAGGGESALRLRLASAGVPAERLDWQVRGFAGPYCDALDLLRPIADAFGETPSGLALALPGGRHRLVLGDLLTVRVAMPRFPAYLRVSYFTHDGEVVHLHPNSADAARVFPAGARVSLGDPAEGGPRWEIGPPYGTEMIVAIASEQPLFDTAREDFESSAAYLAALRDRLGRAGRVAAQVLMVEVAER